MSTDDQVRWTTEEFLAECSALGIPWGGGHIRTLCERGALPFLGPLERPSFPPGALLFGAQLSVSDGVPAPIAAAAATYKQALQKRQKGDITSTIEYLELALDEYGVMGELGALFGLASNDVLKTTRGPVRVEWRLRQALVELHTSTELLPKSPVMPVMRRVSAMTAHHVRRVTSPSGDVHVAPKSAIDTQAAIEAPPAEEIRERWLEGQERERRRQIVAMHKAHLIDVMFDAMSSAPPAEEGAFLILTAEVAQTLLGVPDMALRALKAAAELDWDGRIDAATRLADTYRSSGEAELEAEILRELIEAPMPQDQFLRLLKRLAIVLKTSLDAADETASLYLEAVNSGRYDREVVDRLMHLLDQEHRLGEMLDVLRTVAESSEKAADRTYYFRRLADLARKRLDDPVVALQLLEDVANRTDDDPEVVHSVSELARALGRADVERRALHTLLKHARSNKDRLLGRLITLCVEAGDPKAGTEYVRQLIDLPSIAEPVAERLDTIVPQVTTESGDEALLIRWLKRRVKRVGDPADAFAQWRDIIAMEQEISAPKSQILLSIEVALTVANDADLDEADFADLHMLVGELKSSARRWESAAYHVVKASDALTRLGEPAHAPLDTLKSMLAVRDGNEGDSVLEAMKGPVLASDDPEVIDLFASACLEHKLWSPAAEALEKLAGMLTGPDQSERKAQVFAALAATYEQLNS